MPFWTASCPPGSSFSHSAPLDALLLVYRSSCLGWESNVGDGKAKLLNSWALAGLGLGIQKLLNPWAWAGLGNQNYYIPRLGQAGNLEFLGLGCAGQVEVCSIKLHIL